MNYKIILDAAHGGNDKGISLNNMYEKEYTLLITDYIFKRLKELGINSKRIRVDDSTIDEEERIALIKEFYTPSNNVIVLSNHLSNQNNGTEIIYALRNNNKLAEEINNQLLLDNKNVNKYYQQRDPNSLAFDYNTFIKKTAPNQTILIEYDISSEPNNWEEYAEAIVRALAIYTNSNYIPTENNIYYTVVAGDSLYKIANKYGTTVNNLKILNNLSSDNLSIGQVLKIYGKTTESNNKNYYTVKAGDSLYKIANKFNTTVNDLKALNNLSSNILSIGQKLLLPSNQTIANNNYYTVVAGDSLYKIANKFNTTVNDLKALNNLSTNLLSIGQILKIPSTSNNYTYYTVVARDSLYKIANKFNTTVNELKTLNNLSTNLLSIGQILKIPK